MSSFIIPLNILTSSVGASNLCQLVGDSRLMQGMCSSMVPESASKQGDDMS